MEQLASCGHRKKKCLVCCLFITHRNWSKIMCLPRKAYLRSLLCTNMEKSGRMWSVRQCRHASIRLWHWHRLECRETYKETWWWRVWQFFRTFTSFIFILFLFPHTFLMLCMKCPSTIPRHTAQSCPSCACLYTLSVSTLKMYSITHRMNAESTGGPSQLTLDLKTNPAMSLLFVKWNSIWLASKIFLLFVF